MKVKSKSEVAQSCLTLSDPMDCSLTGSSVHGIFQARVLEWDAILKLESNIWRSHLGSCVEMTRELKIIRLTSSSGLVSRPCDIGNSYNITKHLLHVNLQSGDNIIAPRWNYNS